MNCKIIVTENFKRDARKLLKKYRSLQGELLELQEELLENPRMGTLITENTYKIRLAVKSKGKGKSGGLRVITHVIEVEIELEEQLNEQEITIFLVSLYDKSKTSNVSENELKNYLIEIREDLEEEE